MSIRVLLRTAVLACALPSILGAQIGFESAFKDITDINFFFSCWNAKGALKRASCPSTNSGYGVEVSYDLGKLKLSRTYAVAGGWSDTTRTLACQVPTCATGDNLGPGTVTSYKKHGSQNPYFYLRTEFALSYSQFSGFGSSDTTFDLRGSVREIPGLALYFSAEADTALRIHKILDVIAPYGGIKSGLIQLNGVQALNRVATDTLNYTVYNAAGTAFQVGVTGGIVVNIDRVHLFIERASTIRRFANVQWSAGNSNQIPRKLPTSLDFTGRTVTVGLQFSIKPN